MTDPDVPAVPALPDRAPSFRWRHFAVRLLFVGILLAVAGALPGGRGAPEKFRNREGDIARERVVAPYEFRVEKDEATLRREQEQAAAAVAPVFVVDPRVSSDMLNRFELFREKALAARSHGIKTVILPADNEKDLLEIPKNVLETLQFRFVKTVDDVLEAALQPASKPAGAARAGARANSRPSRTQSPSA